MVSESNIGSTRDTLQVRRAPAPVARARPEGPRHLNPSASTSTMAIHLLSVVFCPLPANNPILATAGGSTSAGHTDEPPEGPSPFSATDAIRAALNQPHTCFEAPKQDQSKRVKPRRSWSEASRSAFTGPSRLPKTSPAGTNPFRLRAMAFHSPMFPRQLRVSHAGAARRLFNGKTHFGCGSNFWEEITAASESTLQIRRPREKIPEYQLPLSRMNQSVEGVTPDDQTCTAQPRPCKVVIAGLILCSPRN